MPIHNDSMNWSCHEGLSSRAQHWPSGCRWYCECTAPSYLQHITCRPSLQFNSGHNILLAGDSHISPDFIDWLFILYIYNVAIESIAFSISGSACCAACAWEQFYCRAHCLISILMGKPWNMNGMPGNTLLPRRSAHQRRRRRPEICTLSPSERLEYSFLDLLFGR